MNDETSDPQPDKDRGPVCGDVKGDGELWTRGDEPGSDGRTIIPALTLATSDASIALAGSAVTLFGPRLRVAWL
jgi:hypothetical protein